MKKFTIFVLLSTLMWAQTAPSPVPDEKSPAPQAQTEQSQPALTCGKDGATCCAANGGCCGSGRMACNRAAKGAKRGQGCCGMPCPMMQQGN